MKERPRTLEKRPLLFVVPDLIGHPGGIARYCQLVRQAIREEGREVMTIALHDARHATASDEWYVACGGSRSRFVLRALLAALRLRPSLILVGHVNFAPLAWVAARIAGSPFVLLVYGTDIWSRLPLVRRAAALRASLWIAISNFTARLASQSNGIEHTRLRILHNCLDPSFIVPDEARDRPERPSLLTVSRITRFEPFKGHDVVIRAMPELLRHIPSLVYDIVGDGDHRPDLERLAQAEGVQDSVRFHGRISHDELAKRYAEATLFIMPSKVEGFGFVFAEAMLHGIPAIGGNVDATPEVILDGETGFVVDPDSVTDIQQAVLALLSNEPLRKRMGMAAREHVLREFSYHTFERKLEAILREAGARAC